MPYASLSELPKPVQRLPRHGQAQFRAAFNSAHKQYDGDEKTAFKVAWAAVKQKYKKSGDDWVRKQDAGGGKTMHQILGELRSVYTRVLDQASLNELLPVKDAIDVIDGVLQDPDEHEPKNDYQRLQAIGDKCVLAVGFDLNQHMGFTPVVPHNSDFPGSLNHKIRCVCKAAKENLHEYLGNWGFVLAVYPDGVVTCASDDYDDYSSEYWFIPYEMDDDCFEITFGDAEPVEVGTVVVPRGTMPQETYVEEKEENKPPADMQSQEDDGHNFKTDNGQKFGKDAYLIVPDPKKPSTWKIRIQETPGKVTVPQLGRAYAALTKGFRGNKVEAAGDDIKAALSKLKGLYGKMKADWPGEQSQDLFDALKSRIKEDPDLLAQENEPSGGDSLLVQSYSVQLQSEGIQQETGVMKVSGIATRANIVSNKKEVYPIEVWQDNIPRLTRLLQSGKLVGECQHPADGRPSLDRTCVKFTNLWQDGNDIRFEADILPTDPLGKNIQILIQNGVSVDISSRGRGSLKQGEWQGTPDVMIVQRGFRCDGFDLVVAGASPGSTITSWQMQSAETVEENEEEDMPNEVLEKLAASMEAMAARLEKMEARTTGDTTVVEQAANGATNSTATAPMVQANVQTNQDDERAKKMVALMEESLVRSRIEDLTQEIKSKRKWAPNWVASYRKLIQNAHPKTLEECEEAAVRAEEIVADIMQQTPQYPGLGHTVEQDAGERGFKNGNELINWLVKDLPDEQLQSDNPDTIFARKDENGNPYFPGHFRTPRRQVRKVLENIARYQDANFNGPAALQGLVMMTQGYSPELVADQVLFQDCPTGSTTVASSGAPQSAIFIFPLVRRVFPQLIATELASVQPMDRPDGKIFFLDAYRQTPGVNDTDAGGNTVANSTRIDRSDSFSSSYANNPGECVTTQQIQLRLSSLTVTADNKKLQANWTIEELQDLRAYHGLDASLELVGSLSREIALEWNQIVLQELVNNATAANLTYGTSNPTGYTQKEWDEYISRYIDKLSAQVFKKRHGDITHIVAGPDAWVKLAATFRTGTHPRDGANPEMYAGLTLTPFMEGTLSNVKTYKTSFWANVNSNTILALRRGADWSDTPYVWAPYLDYVSPVLTLPDTFNQRQGIMSRVAHRTVVTDAIGTISIAQGQTGVTV